MGPVVPAKKRSRAPLWLVVAALLFGLAGWLMSGSDDQAPPQRAEVELPRYLRAEERRRMNQRRTLPALPQRPDPPGPQEPRPAAPRRDPVLVALPPASPGERHSAVVFEANALRHSPLGKLFLDCLLSEHWADLLKRTMAMDVLRCPRCGGRMRVLAYISDPDVTAGILDHLGLPSSPPRLAPARERPQLDFAG